MGFAQESFSSPSKTEDARNCWRTPKALYEAIERCYGTFDVDAAALARTSLAPAYYGPDHEDAGRRDFLTSPIPSGSTKVWCNPPYCANDSFLARCAEWEANGHLVVALVHARTDTEWWHERAMRCDRIILLRGRVPFVRLDGLPSTTPTVGSALLVWTGRHVCEPRPLVVGWDWRHEP